MHRVVEATVNGKRVATIVEVDDTLPSFEADMNAIDYAFGNDAIFARGRNASECWPLDHPRGIAIARAHGLLSAPVSLNA